MARPKKSELAAVKNRAVGKGPGRPKGSKTKAKAGLKMVLKGGVRK